MKALSLGIKSFYTSQNIVQRKFIKRLMEFSPGKFLVYRPNGSGRDTYISSNSGGFRIDGTTLKTVAFQDTLRDRMPSLDHNRTFSHRRNPHKIMVRKIDWYSPKVKRSIFHANSHQSKHSKQLSVPRCREKISKDALIKQALHKTFMSKRHPDGRRLNSCVHSNSRTRAATEASNIREVLS